MHDLQRPHRFPRWALPSRTTASADEHLNEREVTVNMKTAHTHFILVNFSEKQDILSSVIWHLDFEMFSRLYCKTQRKSIRSSRALLLTHRTSFTTPEWLTGLFLMFFHWNQVRITLTFQTLSSVQRSPFWLQNTSVGTWRSGSGWWRELGRSLSSGHARKTSSAPGVWVWVV